LNLNSLYIAGDNYKDNQFKYVSGYWIGVLGMLSLVQKFPNSPTIVNYLTRPSPLSNEGIVLNGDTYTDFIAGVKALYDNKTMEYQTWMAYLTYIRDLNSNKYSDIKTKTFIKLTKQMIQVKIRPHQLILDPVMKVLSGKKEPKDILIDLFKFNEQYKISNNFRKFCLLHRKDLEI